MPLLRFWLAHAAELRGLVWQHALLVAVSTGAAALVGIPVGILAARRPALGRVVLLVASAAQTIPSLALLGFILPLPYVGGLGPRTALVSLSIYALLPILRGTVTGIRGIAPPIIEAGVAMGMTGRQRLVLVELPLALPSIIAGLRVATVIGVGTATIAAAIGAGGLGEYIFRGLAMVDATTILAGAVPAAVMALAADGLLAWGERRVQSGRRLVSAPAVALVAAIAAAVLLFALRGAGTSTTTVVIGSKNFTEQVLLGELIAQTLEADHVPVIRKLNLGGTFVCDRALRTGDLDLYVEYSGTALTAIFHQDVTHDSAGAVAQVRAQYATAGISVLDPLGFNNTFAILVRGDDASRERLRTIEDLRTVQDTWRAGFGYEFLQRQDGYAGLTGAYGLRFRTPPLGMDLSLVYRALAERQVDVIAGDATSAQIDAFHLTALDDTLHYFPPYDAVPVVRAASLLRQPAIGRALGRLAGRISTADMRAMNAAVDLQHREVPAVAAAFLATLPPSTH